VHRQANRCLDNEGPEAEVFRDLKRYIGNLGIGQAVPPVLVDLRQAKKRQNQEYHAWKLSKHHHWLLLLDDSSSRNREKLSQLLLLCGALLDANLD